jgi:murein L,D-transpeptidase YafK
MSRFVLFALLAMLAQSAMAHALDSRDIGAFRAEHKRLAAAGKPLPGTPDLEHLDERIAAKGLPDDSAMMIRIFKAEAQLEVWMSRGQGGFYTLFATYPICNWSGVLGPKLKEGDRQAPEGFYTIALPQANAGGERWPHGLDLGFPNSFDLLHARTGSAILIHGGCGSIGCFAMTNGVHKELHKLAMRVLDAGQPYIPIHVYPFRMTDENMARLVTPEERTFWRNLKEGYDLFERTRRPPRVSVCGARYTFEATGPYDSVNPGPIDVCPQTALVMKDMEAINQQVAAVQDGPTLPEKKPVLAWLPSYLGGPPQPKLTVRGINSLQQLTPVNYYADVSPVLTRPLKCSLALPSCRKYADLRARLAQAEAAKPDKPAKKKKSYRHKRQH